MVKFSWTWGGRKYTIEFSKKRGIVMSINGMSRETRANMTILIAEIQCILRAPLEATSKLEEIEELLQSWIGANDLHPEKVEFEIIEDTSSTSTLAILRE